MCTNSMLVFAENFMPYMHCNEGKTGGFMPVNYTMINNISVDNIIIQDNWSEQYDIFFINIIIKK